MSILWWIFFIWWALVWLPPIRIKFRGYWLGRYIGVTVAPFVFLNEKYYDECWVLCHEYRHVWQMRVLSPVIMAALYAVFFIVRFIKEILLGATLNEAWSTAYWENPFEKDARKHQNLPCNFGNCGEMKE